MCLAWEAYCAGTLPIGAVLLNASGAVVAQARTHRHVDVAPTGGLANTRIAHAELNALAQLPTNAHYQDHVLYSNVEPCCMCLGAVLQTGIGGVRFGWRDRYAGATTCMTVDNPQAARRCIDVAGPVGGVVEKLTGLLMACHYIYLRPGLDHVTAPWRAAEPDTFEIAADPVVASVVGRARASNATVDDLVDQLRRRTAAVDRLWL